MSTSKRNNTRQTVSSVGNAWIVCHSKSHPGYVYYFNTVTREAVWNLSEAEIEKARMTTQMLESQSAKPVLLCPEPKDNPPPMQSTFQNQFENANKFNQRMPFGDKLFPQQQTGLSILPTQKQSGPVFSALPMGDLSAFDLNALRNQINAYNVINSPAVYNPNPWAIQQPFLITPTIPLVNQNQATMHVGYNSLLQNDNHQPASRINHFNNSPLRPPRLFQSNNTSCGGHFKRFKKPLPSNDLRQRLALKRRLSSQARQTEEATLNNKSEEPPAPTGIKKKTADVSAFIADVIEEVTKGNYSTDHKVTALQNEEPPQKLNLEPLKSLATVNAILKNWYIVVDLDVLLEEYNFLNFAADSDEQCTLLIPESVMEELKDYIACSNNIPARRIYHALLERIECGLASIGQKPKQDDGDSITNPILKTCFDLLEENFHLILVTNDSELLRYKKFIKINMFTVDEIKTCLEYEQHRSKVTSYSPITTPKLPCQGQITITIPVKQTSIAQSVVKESTHVESNIDEPIPIDTTIEDTAHKDNDPEQEFCRAGNSQSDQPTVPLKYTMDAAIQTDIITDISESHAVADNIRHNELVESSKSDAIQESSSNIPIQNESNVSVKRREIKLKRTVSGKPPEPPTSDLIGKEKKALRWRRKRYSSQHNSDTTFSGDIPPPDLHNNVSVASPNKNTVNNNKKNNLSENPSINNDTGQANSEAIGSEESSVVCFSTMRENITVEETSTSGIISVTESNIDSEYVRYKHNHNMISSAETDRNVGDMHIDSEIMEESLKTKCEEWISRFIQIMEEVLQVVLHKEKAFLNSELPPPWSLHEAAQCIGKYCSNAAVKRASDKLSNVLFQLSDSSGKISLNMSPSQYMEMYGSGVFLLKELKAITTHEDIQIAEESLQKLLMDIKNPNYGFNDSDIDAHETAMSGVLNESFDSHNSRVTSRSKVSHHSQGNRSKLLHRSEEQNRSKVIQDESRPQFASESPAKKYNLRSRGKSMASPEESPKPVKIIRNFDNKTSFFTNLNLQQVPVNSCTDTGKDSRPENSNVERAPIIFSSCNVSDGSDKSLVHSPNTGNAPNIVRNFTKCPEFEAKLKNTLENMSQNEHDDYLDYEEYYDNTSVESGEYEYEDDEDVDRNDPNVTQLSESSDIDLSDNFVTSSPKPDDSTLATKSNETFKFMIRIFLQEVKNAINDVKILCDKCYAELRNPQLPAVQRNELKNQIENARLHVTGLCISLDSMLDRDSNGSPDNIKNALVKAGVEMSQIDKGLLRKYWSTVANCRKYADVFLFSIQEIIAAFRSISE